MPRPPAKFDKPRHIKYWKRCATLLPEQYTTGDGSRLSLGFFIVAALDLLDALDTVITAEERQSWIKWIYSLQVDSGGFRGFPGTNLGDRRSRTNAHWDMANLHQTFLGLVTLVMLGDDLKRVSRTACLQWVRSLAREHGGFGEMVGEGGIVLGKDDLRSVYCAVGIVYVLASEGEGAQWLDRESIVRHLANCQDVEGAFGQSCLREPHAGLNFCGVGALELLDRIYGTSGKAQSVFASPLLDLTANAHWMLQRQTSWVNDTDSEDDESSDEADDAARNDESSKEQSAISVGFAGRSNKMADTCYCFWNGGALAILGSDGLIDVPGLRQYLYGDTQHMIGGFSKIPGAPPDLLHAYSGLAALAVVGDEGVQPLDSALAVSHRTSQKLEALRRAR